MFRVEDLNLNPSLYVPFQNAKISDDTYLIVKNQSIHNGRMQEELKIESFAEPSELTKPRPVSGSYFHRQTGRYDHPSYRMCASTGFLDQ